MYFHDKKSNTNIDNQFKKENIFSRMLKLLSQHKMIIVIAVVLILIILMIIIFSTRKVKTYVTLNGEDTITLYQGADYIESGYEAHNSKGEDLTSQVIIKSTLDISKIGEYEITYTVGKITKTRKITIVEKPQEYISIYLVPVNNSVNIYLKKGEKYKEPGYQAFSSSGKNLTNEVKITGNVDTSKKGNYNLVYSVVDSNNVTVSVSRTVIVMDTEISLYLANEGYTNQNVTINVGIVDNYYDYMILPNNTKVTSSTYSYKVSENGKYTFTVYTKNGTSKKASIEVKNIDRTSPEGSCILNKSDSSSYIEINATDSSGIQKYIYNNSSYTTNKIEVTSSVNNATVTIYDNAGNNKSVICELVSQSSTQPSSSVSSSSDTSKPSSSSPNNNLSPTISNITKNGVIVTIQSQSANADIAGYYFSYTSTRPNKNNGGYLQTNKKSVDVVRLPGKTYVWVEDKNGKISNYKTIDINTDALLITIGTDYPILENMHLSTYLKNQGWSLAELNKLIARSVRAAGLYTKEAAATSAIALETVLAQKYKIKLPYWRGGKSYSLGAESSWGSYNKYTWSDSGITYYYYGLDCDGLATWAYTNAGIIINTKDHWWYWERVAFSKENGQIGDLIVSEGHVKMIVGKTDSEFITAEAKGKSYGVVVSTHKYTKTNGFKIEKGDLLIDRYDKVSSSKYPSGF